ncbi:hypothetical protein DCAR_0728561 [Daucus carota subsp. sativus]|uniref:Myb-like domain-containing protein n=1 Tax=Daucus carota subsp. sativus TaxID=79200 RepID=A0AAF0XMB8_DAUCS|nr:hypothetical protein DCAR_0728561 [Daucus carota subsp. sativus]
MLLKKFDKNIFYRETVHHRSEVHAAPGTSRGVEIVDNDDLSDASPNNNYGCLSTPEVAKLQENLRSSTLELQKKVKDPLPEALAMAKNVVPKLDCNNNLENEGRNAAKASLMERNKTACTYEWDESSDVSADESRPHLSSHKTRLVTLEKHKNPKPLRRKRKFWSNLEEDTLRAGVQKYGIGNWKLNLDMYRDILNERTDGDLKDKWRNMTA